jgi:3-oxoacyl-[acyl-carrier protein] reductase
MKILITGGASGLGEAVTVRLAQNKDNFIYFTYSKSHEKAKVIQERFDNTQGIKCDFSVAEDVELLLEKINGINPQALINNAYCGDFIKSRFDGIDAKDFLTSFENNIIPVIRITRECILSFKKQKFGRIISVLSSALVSAPPKGTSEYVCNKAYLQELCKVWATEYISYNITSNSISPGMMKTNIISGIDARIIEDIENKHPLKSLLSVTEAAGAIEFMINAGNYLNGMNLILNAGTEIQ